MVTCVWREVSRGVQYLNFNTFLGHPEGANMEQIRISAGFSQLLVQCTKMSLSRGRGGVCFLKFVRKGRFRNVWVGGGGISKNCGAKAGTSEADRIWCS